LARNSSLNCDFEFIATGPAPFAGAETLGADVAVHTLHCDDGGIGNVDRGRRADQFGRRVICPKCGSKFAAVRTPGKRISIAGTLVVILLAVVVVVLAALRFR
jgi:hypothetical protein